MTQTPIVVMPDVPKLVRSYLLGVSQVTNIVDTRVGTRAASTVVYPYLTVQRIGGGEMVEYRLDRAVIDFNAWSDEEETASLLIRTVRAAMKAARGYTTGDAVVTSVTDVLAPQWLPDRERTPPTPRFVMSMAVVVRPNP